MAEPTDVVGLDIFDPEVLEAADQAQAVAVEADEQTVQNYLERRRVAYVNVFKEGHRTQADIDIVLNDLMRFCRAGTSTFDLRDGIHADTLMKIKEGRREVHSRIVDFTRLRIDDLIVKYTDALTK